MNISHSVKWLVPVLLVTATALAACGTDDSPGSGSGAIPAVLDAGRVLTIDDLTAVGFKKSKTYDVEGLTGADAAYFGFWGLDPYDRKDYEVRFYPSHQAALEQGTALALERVGDTAKLKEETATWAVGLKDARQCGGDEASGPASHGIQACTQPKYKAYFIYGNMILFCSGGDAGQSNQRCRELLGQITLPGAA